MMRSFGTLPDRAVFFTKDDTTGLELLFVKDDGGARAFSCTGVDTKGMPVLVQTPSLYRFDVAKTVHVLYPLR